MLLAGTPPLSNTPQTTLATSPSPPYMRMRHTMLQYRVPAIFPIACTCLCQVYPQCSHPIFYASLHLTSFLPREALERQPAEDRYQNQMTPYKNQTTPYKNQTTVTRTR